MACHVVTKNFAKNRDGDIYQFKEWVCAIQVTQKLHKAKAAVAAAEAATLGHESALSDKERQKKWMKF